MNSYVLHQNKIKKNINAKNFLQNSKQEFPCQSLENFSGEYYNMENNILDFQFEPVCAKQARPNYSVGSNQDEAEIQYDRCSTHRSSHQRCSMKKCVFSNFVKFTGIFFLIIEKETLEQVFSHEFYKISKESFYRALLEDCFKIGATVKNMKRCQPVKNGCAITKFGQLRHFI